ncbi:MAG: DUF1272 domain-containing protein [Candidatus Eremiobacteraeota bacterium]|nr:DUF1272 domain-containing protein [Candidatus Eremiobacteraeota bacterium]
MGARKGERCQRCRTRFAPGSSAMACTHACTFCAACAAKLAYVCPNCNGALTDSDVSPSPKCQER